MPSIINATTTNGVAVTGDNSGALALQTNNGTTAVTIDTSQNVGIGTSSPAQKLQVSGASSTYLRVTSSNASTGSGLFTANATREYLIGAGAASGNSNLEFRDVTGAATRMSIDTSGNVGIGTTSPAANLEVSAASTNGVVRLGQLQIKNSSGNYSGGTNGVFMFPFTDSIFYTDNYNGGFAWRTGTSSTERVRIDSNGNVGIGTTSPSGRLGVVATSTQNGINVTSVNNHGIYSEVSGTGYGVYGRSLNSSYGGILGYDHNNTAFGILGYVGYGLYSNTSINVVGTIYTSDARLKENVVPIQNALSVIKQLNPVSFDWKANSAKGISNGNKPLPDYGMIAQEVEQVIPEIVTESAVPQNPAGTDTPPSLDEELGTKKGLDYSRLIPFLTAAIQELNAKVEAQAAEIAALKNPPQPVTE
jgi:hypothetical protein